MFINFFYLEPIFKGAQNAEELLVCILMLNSDQTSMDSYSWCITNQFGDHDPI